jgi:hypothetical protein
MEREDGARSREPWTRNNGQGDQGTERESNKERQEWCIRYMFVQVFERVCKCVFMRQVISDPLCGPKKTIKQKERK